MGKRVLLGMSGGVDSSTSAVLLQKQGYDVIGITLRLWEDEENTETLEGGCCSFSSAYDAKRVCDNLNIPHYTLDFKTEFKKYVIDNFIQCYKNCKTPNPCIECNRHIKFNLMYKKAEELQCEYIATGHYAKTEYSEKYKQYVLKKSNEEKKDQTYFLYSIPKDIIPKIIFPLAEYEKKGNVREIAKENNLAVAEKKDSQEVCFIPDNDYGKFLEKNINEKIKTGNIVLKNGEILGKHRGLIYYTVGQRKGLGIAYKEPLYVLNLDKEKNELIVGTEEELYNDTLYAEDLNFLVDMDKWDEKIYAKIRYRANIERLISVNLKDNKLKVTFEKKQRAITKGQSVVFYDIDGVVLGGGKIA